ncbi:MAG: sensor histidine kinase [Acidimicrobiales bacterium]
MIPEQLEARARVLADQVVRAPFTRRTWSELWFLVVGTAFAAFGLAFVAFTMAVGVAFAVTFFGLAVIGLSVRGARGIGRMQRGLARSLLEERIEEPAPFTSRPGFLGWLQAALRDRTGWRSMAYVVVKAPLAFVEILVAFSVWFDAFTCLVYPLSGASQPAVFGIVRVVAPSYLLVGRSGFVHGAAVFVTGIILFFLAPWAVRGVLYVDRHLMRGLLGPDATARRVRSLESARAQTVDASAATLRRIERDLHDGTQAQLVAVAMRLGLAKEKLADPDNVDLDSVRELVDSAHRGAKETIVELRDLARGIHPPALDIGLEGALSTLAARSTVPTDLTVTLKDRPAPAIEAIAYFCVAELLANVAQHAQASRAAVSCAQHGRWLRVVVRDDGIGGARAPANGTASSGLRGLRERVGTVDGRLEIVSPKGGPTVATVDLPLQV